MPGEWGTLGFDDEGHITQRNVLIEDGILTDYMWDYLRARKDGRPQSGNGRRQSYQHLPMVRMTNTFVLDGPDDPDDIIASTPNGVYVAKLGGGSVNTATGDFVFGMTEAYLIENGEITEPLREGNLIGNGPKVLQDIDMLGNDFAMGSPGTCGKDGQGVPVGDGQPTLRVKSLTIGGTSRHDGAFESELQAIADRVVEQAKAGEQIEAFVSRGGETEVRVYEGDVEHFVSAQSEGIGIRVIDGGRTGFAYAGTLDADAIADVLAQARDNVQFGTVDEYAALAEADGVPVTEQSLWNDELAAYPTDRKIDLAKELEKLASGADHRVRVDDSNYADAYGESAVATTTGIRMSGRENGCYVSVSTLADEGEGDDAETQTGFGFSVGRVAGRVRSRQGRPRGGRSGHPVARRDEAVDEAV